MFFVYLADTPVREVRAEEIRPCKACRKKSKHRYEEISFHTKLFFVKIFCNKKRYARICGACNFGEELDMEEFESEVGRLLRPSIYHSPPSLAGENNEPAPRYRMAKKQGIKYCNNCGRKIYPDIGYCASCAVRGSDAPTSKKKRKKRKKR